MCTRLTARTAAPYAVVPELCSTLQHGIPDIARAPQRTNIPNTGDGMTHAVRIKGGRASYANRYVETHRLQTEKAAGFPIYEKVPQ